MKGLTFILLLSLLSLMYSQILAANKPMAKRTKQTTGDSPYAYKPPGRLTFTPRGSTTTPKPNPLRPKTGTTLDCPKRKFEFRGVCETDGICRLIKCPVLSCTERIFFKTAAEMTVQAKKVGAAEVVSLETARRRILAYRRNKRSSMLGCGNYILPVGGAVSITDHVTNKVYSLASIPAGCEGDGALHQLVFMNGCTEERCCDRRGWCNPKTFAFDYLDGDFEPITVEQVLYCDCENTPPKIIYT